MANPLLRRQSGNSPVTPKESGHAYQKIWTTEGSPLVVISRGVHQKLQGRLTIPVELTMRYQNPSIASAEKKLAEKKVNHLLVISASSLRHVELRIGRRAREGSRGNADAEN